jgi:hypothetical protein
LVQLQAARKCGGTQSNKTNIMATWTDYKRMACIDAKLLVSRLAIHNSANGLMKNDVNPTKGNLWTLGEVRLGRYNQLDGHLLSSWKAKLNDIPYRKGIDPAHETVQSLLDENATQDGSKR